MNEKRHIRVGSVLVLMLLALPVMAAVLTEKYYYEVKRGDERGLDVRLDLAMGRVLISRAPAGFLFQGEVEIEGDTHKPRFSYDTRDRRGRLTVDMEQEERARTSIRGVSNAKSSLWNLKLGDAVPINLQVDMGMANGEFDFTGIPLENLAVDCGISTTAIVFHARNPVEMEQLAVDAGASKFAGYQLGNARFKHFVFDGGAGKFHLDFSGRALRPGSRADVDVGMAHLRIVVPDHLPVILRAPDSWTSKVRVPDGYVKESDGVYRSPNARAREDAFFINVDAGIGQIIFVTPAEADKL